MRRIAFAIGLAAMALSSQPALAAEYVIDTKGAHASINFRIQHLGFSWLTGRFNTFSGSFSFDAANPEASKVNVTIDTASIDSNHAERDKHLRNPDFLDVTKFPKATFVSKSVSSTGEGRATIVGDLTLHGVTKEVKIDATYVGSGSDPWGGERAGFTGTTTLALKDFGINYDLGPKSATVALQLEVEGVKKK